MCIQQNLGITSSPKCLPRLLRFHSASNSSTAELGVWLWLSAIRLNFIVSIPLWMHPPVGETNPMVLLDVWTMEDGTRTGEPQPASETSGAWT